MKGSVSVTALVIGLFAATQAHAQSDAPVQLASADIAQAQSAPKGGAGEEIIVTGTRSTGITAAESATPIKVLDDAALSHVGQPNLSQALTQLVPSFVAQSFGGDTANLTLSARLRGISPNHTLVLVNGKRRHGSANLHVLGGPYQGAASPDLDLIPPEAIARIEVLEQGAAAQYGSDAIAGVINIILKNDDEGGSGSFTGGRYYKGGGDTLGGQMHIATRIGDKGYFNLTGMYRFHDFSQQGGLDLRVTDANGTLLSSLTPAQAAIRQQTTGYPNINKIVGDSRSRLATFTYNTGYDLGGVTVYSFGSYSRRTASAYENVRLPDRIIASPTLGVAGSLTTPGAIIFAPKGFSPREGLVEQDFALTGGIKGEIGGWKWDLSSTYGEDHNEIYTYDSANASLFVDTHFTPTDFYDGSFRNQELTANLDVARELDLGMAAPLTLAFGAEYREGRYTIGKGDPASTYKEGGQSYPGFTASDAGAHSRNNQSIYLDVAATPVTGLKLDGALRWEHYSDFGEKLIWKATGRYDFNPAFALRGTVSTGFRAPTLAEEYYSATNVSPTSATVQLPANAAAAGIVGFQPLKPETSTTFSAGAVFRPVSRLAITIDAYQVKIKNRIVGSSSIVGKSGGVVDPVTGAAVLAAIAAHGNILDPTVGNVSVASFINGVDTRTRGVDLTFSYPTPVAFGTINWTLSGNYNETKVTRVRSALVDVSPISNLEDASPKVKLVAGANLTAGPIEVTLRETFYGKTSALYRYSGNYDYLRNAVGFAAITDFEASYDFGGMKLALGANNLFDKKPEKVSNQLAARGASAGLPSSLVPSSGTNVWNSPLTISPYGINGGYYYARLSFKF